MDDMATVVITIEGRDRPGVTAAVFGALCGFGVDVLDVEQMVLRGRLVLGILVSAPRDTAKLQRALTATAERLGMQVELTGGVGDGSRSGKHRRGQQASVVVLGQPLTPAAVSAVTGRIADTGANIDSIVRMARYPVTALEFEVSGTDVDALRKILATEAATERVDVAVQRMGLIRHGRRLVVMDVDSTLVQGEAIDLLAARAGVRDQVRALTERAMSGELDFETALRQRVGLLAGLPVGALDEVYADLPLAPGARTLVRTLKRLGYRFGIVSGGFTHVTDRLVQDLEIDYATANQLEVVGDRLTGQLIGPVVDRAGKAAALRRFAEEASVTLDRTVAIGDGANDLDMLAIAGLGVAFNAKPVVREAAHAAVNVPFLDAVLYLLGISREDVEAADADAGLTPSAPPVG